MSPDPVELGEANRAPLAYLSPEDHDRRYTEADNPGPWVDWATMTLRKVPHP